MGDFTELFVWREARVLCSQVYSLTKNDLVNKDWGFKDQMRRASISVTNNIAEGDEMGSNRQSVKFLNIAKGSCAEVRSMVYIGMDLGYISKETGDLVEDQCLKISAMLRKLIAKRKGE